MSVSEKKILIDLEVCYRCERCAAECSYPHHPANEGYVRLIALGVQEHVCRRCEDAPCVASCPQSALEKRPDGMLNRYSLRCTSCKTCTAACPFGVIMSEIVEYKTSQCDLCSGRCDDSVPPACASSCPSGAISWVDDPSAQPHVHPVRGGRYFVRTIKWERERL